MSTLPDVEIRQIRLVCFFYSGSRAWTTSWKKSQRKNNSLLQAHSQPRRKNHFAALLHLSHLLRAGTAGLLASITSMYMSAALLDSSCPVIPPQAHARLQTWTSSFGFELFQFPLNRIKNISIFFWRLDSEMSAFESESNCLRALRLSNRCDMVSLIISCANARCFGSGTPCTTRKKRLM